MAVFAAFVLAVFVFVGDPKTTIRLTNDYETRVDLSFCGGSSAEPGHQVSLPIEIFDAHPCFLYAGGSRDRHPVYLGCLRFDPLVNREKELSSVVSDLSEEACWATAPR